MHFFRKVDHKAFRATCYFILGGCVSFEMAFFYIYGDDPEGGPEMGPHIFNVLLARWQQTFLRKLDLEWRSHKIAGVSFYEIVPTFKLKDPKRFSFSRGKHGDGAAINSQDGVADV